MREYNWVFALRDGNDMNDDNNSSNEILDMIEVKLGNHVSTLLEETENLFIDLSNPDSVLKVKKLMDSLS